MTGIKIYEPSSLSKITWSSTRAGKVFPKFDNNSVPGFNRGEIYGCKLYFTMVSNLYKDLKSKYNKCKWVSSEHPFYYKSLYARKKDGDYKLTIGFSDFFVVYKGYSIAIEVDEDKPHSTSSAIYFNNNPAAWLKKQMADKGKDKYLYDKGVICMHIPEKTSYEDVLDIIGKLFDKLDKYD